jgi:hypothetical protein
MTLSPSAGPAFAALAEEEPVTVAPVRHATMFEQDMELCFVCLRWTTDAPECRGEFHGCDLQPLPNP